MQENIVGTWRLITWRRLEADGSYCYPFEENPRGILIYTEDGNMAVQMVKSNRPRFETNDALGGSEQQRAAAYSSCLAYFGGYEVQGQSVIHHVEASLFPNWSETVQNRPFLLDGDRLTLQVKAGNGQVTNEIIWRRAI